jgi:hypothetical protein
MKLPTTARPCHVTLDDEREFQAAMDAYKKKHNRPFPTWSEVLEVLREIGYAKRIWKPVDASTAHWLGVEPLVPLETLDFGATPAVQLWCSRVETSIGP